MKTIFRRQELPVAYAMIDAARRIRPRRDAGHLYDQYFLYWTAFHAMYTTVARRKGYRTNLEVEKDGSIVTQANGHVSIPKVIVASEVEQIHHALAEFNEDLREALIHHQSTDFFARRTPFWEGEPLESDAFGQRLNGVININYTSGRQYPVWSPIDVQWLEELQQNPENQEVRASLVRQIVELLYTVRLNLMTFNNKLDDSNDLTVIEHALPLLGLIVEAFTR